MGLLKLTGFRAEVTRAFGEDLPTPEVDRALNLVIAEIAGSIEFDDLLSRTAATSTASGTVALDPRVVEVKSVRHVGNAKLSWVDPVEFDRLEDGETGNPTVFTRIGRNVHLYPNPGVTNVLLMTRLSPEALDDPADLSPFPSSWDLPIVYLAISHLLYLRNEDDRANTWFTRAVTSLGQRITDADRQMLERGLGLTVDTPDERKVATLGRTASAI